jgi:hypothetical protein
VERATYPSLELGQIGGAQGIRLCNHGDQVDTCAELLHHLDVEGLQRVAGGADEVQAGVHAEIDLIAALRLLLLQHERLVLVVEELDDGLPGVAVVDVVAEAGGVDDGQADCPCQYAGAWDGKCSPYP